MWIFTPKGFISAVAWRGCKRTLCVRARKAEHLAAIFPHHDIIVTETADYRYRCRVERKAFEGAIAAEIRLIGYNNFKKEITDPDYHDAALGVWNAMYALQQRLQAPRRRWWELPEEDQLDLELAPPPATEPPEDDDYLPWRYD